MEARDSVGGGVTVIGADAPSNYHIAPRTENPTQVEGAVTVAAGVEGTVGKKKRGRPRKYGPDGTLARTLSPLPISSSAPPLFSGGSSVDKRGRGRPIGSENKQRHKGGLENSGELVASSAGANFMPHLITVSKGEDITMKIISFTKQGPRAICVISAVGLISNATLRQADSSGGTMTYEGIFEILSLTGSFTPTEAGSSNRSGGLSVLLASPNGRVVGGMLAGLLVAGGPVQVVVGSFLPSGHQEQKPKKQKMEPNLALKAPDSAAAISPSVEQESYRVREPNNSAAPKPSPGSSTFQPQNWVASMETGPNFRNSTTDINISLQGD